MYYILLIKLFHNVNNRKKRLNTLLSQDNYSKHEEVFLLRPLNTRVNVFVKSQQPNSEEIFCDILSYASEIILTDLSNSTLVF